MRGAVFTEHGDASVIHLVEDLPMPEPAAGEVRVQIHAAALNRLDLWVRDGWPGLKLHMQNAVRLGATAGEIMEVLAIVSVIGIHAATTAAPILAELADPR